MRGYRYWTDAERAEASALYDRLRDYSKVGLRYGVTGNAVRNQIMAWRKRSGCFVAKDPGRPGKVRAIRDRLREAWPDTAVSLDDLERELQTPKAKLRRYAGELGLGRKATDYNAADRVTSIRPARPSGRGARYEGRRYEDDPRDPPAAVPLVLQTRTMPGSWCGCAAAMCMGVR